MANFLVSRHIVYYYSSILVSVWWFLIFTAISCRTSLKKWLRGNSSNAMVSLHVCVRTHKRSHSDTVQIEGKLLAAVLCHKAMETYLIILHKFKFGKKFHIKVSEKMWTNSKRGSSVIGLHLFYTFCRFLPSDVAKYIVFMEYYIKLLCIEVLFFKSKFQSSAASQCVRHSSWNRLKI